MRKMGITEKGKTWCGCSIDDPVLLSLAAETIEKLGWVGPLEIEVIRDRDTGKYTIIEINPVFQLGSTWQRPLGRICRKSRHGSHSEKMWDLCLPIRQHCVH